MLPFPGTVLSSSKLVCWLLGIWVGWDVVDWFSVLLSVVI
jgi:hypothetical protein